MATDNDEGWGVEDSGAPYEINGISTAPEEGLAAVNVPVPGSDGWIATWIFSVVGPPKPVRMTVRHRRGDNPPEPLSIEILRRVRIDDARQQLIDRLPSPQFEALFGVAFNPLLVRSRPGRRGRDDLFYATLAAEYDALCRGGSRTPTKDLAARHHLSTSQIGNLVHAARRKGFLSSGEKGQPGGVLTGKAERVIRGAR